MNEKLQFFITLDQITKLFMNVGMPYLYDDAFLEPGTHPVDVIVDGYAHILGEGYIKCTSEVLLTCPHYIQDEFGFCNWNTDCMSTLCIKTCILKVKLK